MSTPTPGPWDRTNLTIHTQGTQDFPALKIARVYEANIETEAARTVEQATANARLIAASPDLYEALKAIVETASEACECVEGETPGHCMWCVGRKGIAKAEGRVRP